MSRIAGTRVQVTGTQLTISGISGFAVVGDKGTKRVSPDELLTWISGQDAVTESLPVHSRGRYELRVDSLMTAFIYLIPRNGVLYFGPNLGDLVRLGGMKTVSLSSLLMLLEAGFVIPPFTIIEDVYRLWPYTAVSITGQQNSWAFRVVDTYREPESSSMTYQEALEAVRADLTAALEQEAQRSADRTMVFTVSGGIDSSLLLMLGSSVLDMAKASAATVASPGQAKELRRAIAAGRFAQIGQHVIITTDQIPRGIGREYIRAFGEPVYDGAVRGEVALLREARRALKTDSLTIVEGQCADTVYLGLPHNLMMALRGRLSPLARQLTAASHTIWNMTSRYRRDSPFGRFLYRSRKASWTLGARTDEEAFMASLGITGAFRSILADYYEQVRNVVSGVFGPDTTLQRGIGRFFLSRVIPVREMQKYRLGVAEGMVFSFPYMDRTLLATTNALPDEYLIAGRKRKRILFDLARRVLPQELQTRSTAPFYLGVGRAAESESPQANGVGSRLKIQGPATQVLDLELLTSTVEQLLEYVHEAGLETSSVEAALRECGISLAVGARDLTGRLRL